MKEAANPVPEPTGPPLERGWSLRGYLGYVREHLRQDFHPLAYGLTALWLAIAIGFNYAVDLEDSVIDADAGKPIRFVWYLLLYAFGWYPVAGICLRASRQLALVRSWKFWGWSGFGLVVMAFDRSFYGYYSVTEALPAAVYPYAFRLANNLASLVTIFLPLVLFYRLTRPRPASFYGLTTHGVNWRPYLLMLLVMMPLIAAASFEASFLRQYPNYRPGQEIAYLGLPEWVTALSFELAYGWDFVAVELLFRGFFAIGLGLLMGRNAVLPMTVAYAFLHFGKPLGETVSSVVGGYILGILAQRTGNIWGGVALHLGVAWLMELAAFLQKALR